MWRLRIPSRYDLFLTVNSPTPIAVTARTRGQDTHLVHMMQRGCDSHRRRLLQTTRLDEATQTWLNNAQNPGSAIPPVTTLEEVMILTCPTARMKMTRQPVSRTQLLVGASVFKMRPGSSTVFPRKLLLRTESLVILLHSSSLTVYPSRKNRKHSLFVQLRFLQGLAFHQYPVHIQRLGPTPEEWPATECAMNFSSGGYLVPKCFLVPP